MDFTGQILQWYGSSRRDLPWRHTQDPYKIWLSEVILQQTRVEQGMAYYQRFVSEYPGIEDLAKAPEQKVLKLWQGLGYYSRARNLLFASKQLMNEFNGVFPSSYKQIKTLKGVGDYTAAAIASIAFGEAVAVVDGNVKRVISRIYGLELTGTPLYNKVRQVMTDKLDPNRPGDFNQAVMEFGALQCTPKNPSCATCIFQKECQAYCKGMVDLLPVLEKKKKPLKRYFSYFVVRIPGKQGGVIMRKRTKEDIWKNLYEFPLIETETEFDTDKLQLSSLYRSWFGENVKIIRSSKPYKHQLTHRTIFSKFYFIELGPTDVYNADPSWEIIPLNDIHKYPVSRLIDRFLKEDKSKINSTPNT